MKANELKRVIPDIFTLANLVSGFIAVIKVFEQEYVFASVLIVIAMVFDLLDGKVARWLDITSSLGKELDSLADAISFVIAPALLVYFRIFEASTTGLVVSIVIAVCGILRLAKFNTLKPLPYFIGVPTPWFTAIVIIFVVCNFSLGMPANTIIFLALALSMVSPLKLPNFKLSKRKDL